MFERAVRSDKKLKIFLWGETGTGKTRLALHFPRAIIFDLEKGSDLYGDDFSFDVFRPSSLDEVYKGLAHLRTCGDKYRTLIIDPVSIIWEWLQAGIEKDEIGPKDWSNIKTLYKRLLYALIDLDMHVIVTARSKTRYRQGAFMVAAGETFDSDKSTDYVFDIVMQLKVEDGRQVALCHKDRTGHFPATQFPTAQFLNYLKKGKNG